MGVLKWHREGKAVTLFLLLLLSEQGKQPELRNGSTMYYKAKGRNSLFVT